MKKCLINWLPKKERELALKRREEDSIEKVSALTCRLEYAFKWISTPEGWSYWNDIFEKYAKPYF